MATLQAARTGSEFYNRPRLNLATSRPPAQPNIVLKADPQDAEFSAEPRPTSEAKHQGLSELEHRQLMLQVASIYPGWQLVSMQHRPENSILVAHLVRASDEPNLAIREGRSLQIIMDENGDLRIRHPHPKQDGILARLLRWLAGARGYYSFTN